MFDFEYWRGRFVRCAASGLLCARAIFEQVAWNLTRLQFLARTRWVLVSHLNISNSMRRMYLFFSLSTVDNKINETKWINEETEQNFLFLISLVNLCVYLFHCFVIICFCYSTLLLLKKKIFGRSCSSACARWAWAAKNEQMNSMCWLWAHCEYKE